MSEHFFGDRTTRESRQSVPVVSSVPIVAALLRLRWPPEPYGARGEGSVPVAAARRVLRTTGRQRRRQDIHVQNAHWRS